MYLSEKDDYDSMRKDAFEFAKEKYFNGYPDTHSVQENFNLITSFIRRRNKTHAEVQKTGSKKLKLCRNYVV